MSEVTTNVRAVGRQGTDEPVPLHPQADLPQRKRPKCALLVEYGSKAKPSPTTGPGSFAVWFFEPRSGRHMSSKAAISCAPIEVRAPSGSVAHVSPDPSAYQRSNLRPRKRPLAQRQALALGGR